MAPAATPTTFETVVGNALLCLDRIDPAYFKTYLTTYFKPPVRTEGDAYWFRPESIGLYGMEVNEIFVSTESSPIDFLGVILNEKLAQARQKIFAATGIRYLPGKNPAVLRSPAGGFLMQYATLKTKLVCVIYRNHP
ncbi:MAG TPA: hypothetical protein DEP05_01835 [Betaproteobacteria bacterium]|nr:hypothetical protein [Betaproteobacteria bacterium]